MTQPQATPDRAPSEPDPPAAVTAAAPAGSAPAPAGSAPAPAGSAPAPRERRLHAARVRFRAYRMKVRARPSWNLAWRLGIGVLGTVVLVLGVIAIPYPGPGWLIVFAGLGILATEFTWAGRLLTFARGYYDAWSAWVLRQNRVVQVLLGLVSAAVVLAMLWLLGALWFAADLVGLDQWTWLQSPLTS